MTAPAAPWAGRVTSEGHLEEWPVTSAWKHGRERSSVPRVPMVGAELTLGLWGLETRGTFPEQSGHGPWASSDTDTCPRPARALHRSIPLETRSGLRQALLFLGAGGRMLRAPCWVLQGWGARC